MSTKNMHVRFDELMEAYDDPDVIINEFRRYLRKMGISPGAINGLVKVKKKEYSSEIAEMKRKKIARLVSKPESQLKQ